MVIFLVISIITAIVAKRFWKEGSPLEFFNVVDHELTHSIFALLFRRKVIELYANSNGTGHATYATETSAFSARVTSLAPYLISVGAVFVIIIQLLGASKFLLPLPYWVLSLQDTEQMRYLTMHDLISPILQEQATHGQLCWLSHLL